jgi:WXG100 family type VII secretion target
MPEGYKVSGDDLAKAQQDTNTVYDNSRANINSMKSQLGGLEGAWVGEASTAFHALMERFNTSSDKLLQDLQQISENLGTAAKRYGHQETETSQAMKNAGGGYAF